MLDGFDVEKAVAGAENARRVETRVGSGRGGALEMSRESGVAGAGALWVFTRGPCRGALVPVYAPAGATGDRQQL